MKLYLGIGLSDDQRCVGAQTLTAAQARAERKAALLKKAEEEDKRNSDMWASVRELVKLPSFQVLPPCHPHTMSC